MLLKSITTTRRALINKYSTNVFNKNSIFAVSSGQGKCGVAVLRISGPQAAFALKQVTGLEILPKPRYATLRSIRNPQNGDVLDKGLVIWFPGPHSFTGEDSFELQVHGGHAVISGILNALASIPSLRLAAPGEFTRRAFYNGKLDLTEVEGIADLLAAETEIQRKQAFLQMQGHLRHIYDEWKSELTNSLASLEAYIDFQETENLENNLIEEVSWRLEILSKKIEKHLNDQHRGERLRNGVKTVILGEPNVGKSSLLNILCQRPAAIVTPLEGTTRDVLDVTLDISGYPLILSDTAGLRSETEDIIEQEGIQRAFRAYREADFVLLVVDCTKYASWYNSRKNKEDSFLHYLKFYLKKLNIDDILKVGDNDCDIVFDKQCIVIGNKIDLIEEDKHIFNNSKMNLISCKLEDGFQALIDKITNKLKLLCSEPSKEHPCMSQERHREHVKMCLKYLKNALVQSKSSHEADSVLMTESVRKALRQLEKITGTVTTEQLLDIIFKEFCIGK